MLPIHIGQECWFYRNPKDSIWDEGRITAISDTEVVINNTVKVHRSLLHPKNNDSVPIHDLVRLHHLSRPSMVYVLTHRYNNGEIYTYSGPILIALNPYRHIPLLYNSESMKRFHDGLGASDPHVYNVTERAYRALCRTGTSQSILVSGESGAGKTETTKHVLAYLSFVSNQGINIKDKVLASTPLLEALGNAKTIHNDNSSRFGKFISIYFKHGSICGASIQTYLLERSRIVKPRTNERNFHIFYQIAHCTPKQKRTKYGLLDNPEQYRYLQGSTTEPHDIEDYKNTLDALRKLGFTDEEENTLHIAISAVLAIGNIEFKEEDKNVVTVVDPKTLQLVGKLLNCDDQLLQNALTQRLVTVNHGNITTPGSVYVSKHTKPKCEQSRDSFAMLLYSKLMTWIVKRINDVLKPRADSNSNIGTTPRTDSKSEEPFIGVLDIYGFESFERNGFEQLCINYANEKLQRQFNQHVFTKELEEYKSEGINCDTIAYPDNTLVIDAIEGNSVPGIIQYLDDQCKTNTGSDKAFSQSLLNSHIDKSVLKRSDKVQDGFVLVHYADRVMYNVEGFVERNVDYVVDEHMTVLKRKECLFFRLFDDEETTIVPPKRSGSVRRGSSNGVSGSFVLTTVASRFRDSLNGLLLMINSTDTHYIRCIKPNSRKIPTTIDTELIVRQLGCSGVFESVRVVMAGFPTRISHTNFVSHYGCIIMSKLHADKKENIKRILTSLSIDSKSYRIGNTKVFMAAGVAAKLDYRRTLLNRVAIMVQKSWKRYKERIRYVWLRHKIYLVVAACKAKIERHLYITMVKSSNTTNGHISTTNSTITATNGHSNVIAVSSCVSIATSSSSVSTNTNTNISNRGLGWKSGAITTMTNEKQQQYEREMANLREEISVLRVRDIQRDKDLIRLEDACLLSLQNKYTTNPCTELLGSAVGVFDKVRDELSKHYNSRINTLFDDLKHERDIRIREKEQLNHNIVELRYMNKILLEDVEELRINKETNDSNNNLDIIASEIGAEANTVVSILAAMKNRDKERHKHEQEYVETLIRRYETRLELLDSQNKELIAKLETVLLVNTEPRK